MGLISKSFYQPYTPFKAHHVCSSVHIKQKKLLRHACNCANGSSEQSEICGGGKGESGKPGQGVPSFQNDSWQSYWTSKLNTTEQEWNVGDWIWNIKSTVGDAKKKWKSVHDYSAKWHRLGWEHIWHCVCEMIPAIHVGPATWNLLHPCEVLVQSSPVWLARWEAQAIQPANEKKKTTLHNDKR